MNEVGYPILLDVLSNMGFAALMLSSIIPMVQMGGLMVFAMLACSFGTLTLLASAMELGKNNLKWGHNDKIFITIYLFFYNWYLL